MAILEPEDRAAEIARVKRRRRALERVVEKALARLDRMDGDPDLEDGADAEPSLCGVSASALTIGFGEYVTDDREGDGESPGEADREPSLGSLGLHETFDQRRWACGDMADREVDDGDREPWLGWSEPTCSVVTFPWGGQIVIRTFDPLDQSRPSVGQDDREVECDDEGFDSDRESDSDAEPDLDGDGTPNPHWTIHGRSMCEVHGVAEDPLCSAVTQRSPLAAITRSGLSDTGERRGGRHASRLSHGGPSLRVVDPDEVPDTLAEPRTELGLAR